MSEEPTPEEACELNDRAWALIHGLNRLDLAPEQALFVLLLAAAKFVAAVPAEHRQGHLEALVTVLTDMVPLSDVKPEGSDGSVGCRRFDA